MADIDAQRVALEEMSQALLERLNAMVAEQEKRAADFAARTHSLSALPEAVELPKVEAAAPAVAAVPAPLPSVPPLKNEHKERRQTGQRVAPPPGARSAAEAAQRRHEPQPQQPTPPRQKMPKPAAARGGQQESSQIGLGWMFFVMAVIYFLIRACSH